MRHPKARQLAISSFALVAAVCVASPARADTPGCASHAEVDGLRAGMSAETVRALFDTHGYYDGDGANDTYRISFRTCWAPGERKVVTFYAYTDGLLRRWDIRDV